MSVEVSVDARWRVGARGARACICSIISIKGAAVGEASVVNGLFNLCDIYQHKHNQFLVSHFASFRFCCRTINISANFGMNNLADN